MTLQINGIGAVMWDNGSAPGGATNTLRGLTRSLDLTKEGLAMKATRVCTVPECAAPVRCKDLCSIHYDRVRHHGTTDLVERTRQSDVPCRIEDCTRPGYALALCKLHHKRNNVYGDPRAAQPIRKLPTRAERADVVARILAQSKRTPSGCIVYGGTTIPSGYGTIGWQGRSWVTHRAMWTVLVGPIPEGLAPDGSDWTIDHLCSNRLCVNVGHLEVVSRIENSNRGGGLLRAQAANRARWAQTKAASA